MQDLTEGSLILITSIYIYISCVVCECEHNYINYIYTGPGCGARVLISCLKVPSLVPTSIIERGILSVLSESSSMIAMCEHTWVQYYGSDFAQRIRTGYFKNANPL